MPTINAGGGGGGPAEVIGGGYEYNPELTADQNPYYYEKNKMLYDLHVERVKRNSHWRHAAPQTKEQVCLFYKEHVNCYAMIVEW